VEVLLVVILISFVVWAWLALTRPVTTPRSVTADNSRGGSPPSTPVRSPVVSGSTNLIEDLGHGVSLEMVAIPGGSIMTGSPASEAGRDYAGPQRQVALAPFWMGKYEITQAQWRVIMGNNPSYFKGDMRPVEQVSWNDALGFCYKLAALTGRGYALPSEDQWHYACRAGSSTQYFFANSAAALGEYAWFWENSDAQTHAVGGKLPNPWGLYDIYGNVWEWCRDPFSINGPGPGTPALGISGQIPAESRAVRGGAWSSRAGDCSTSHRVGYRPDFRELYIGFRVVVLMERTR